MTYDHDDINGSTRKGRSRKKSAKGLLPAIAVLRRGRQQSAVSDTTSFNPSDEERICEHGHAGSQLLRCHISTTTTGGTFGYQRALINRIRYSAFFPGAPYDAATHKPTFVHDTLMLPGTLANLIEMNSPEDLIPSMTPALLYRVHAHIDLESMRPILVATQRAEDHVQGMLVFGLGKQARDVLRTYYHPCAHRRKVAVDFEVCVETVPDDGAASKPRWQLERRAICAYAWFKSGLDDCELSAENGNCPNWNLEDFLEGKLSLQESLRIESSGRGDEDDDGYIGRDIVECESEPEEVEREVIYSGAGTLSYVRAPWPTAW